MDKTFERFDKPSIEFVTISCNIHRLQFSRRRQELRSFAKYLSQFVRIEQRILGVLLIQHVMYCIIPAAQL